MHKIFLQVAAFGVVIAALLSVAITWTQSYAQGLGTPESPSGAQGMRRIIVELSAPPLVAVYNSLADRPALQRDLLMRVAQLRIALEQAIFIAQVTDARIGALVTGRAQMTANSVSLSVRAEKVPLIGALRGVKAVYPDPTVERNRP
ncbi:MAG: hypothetical protein CUN49_01940 [Candidatus Thermofonsia Clade 1 bacterium]|jgi:hypothetical protein|uniref:Uncharacterized protein n=1 Tax=Candidatus Thermofonsia Clade 1 bacterium TaxID=2364210 RepID=A0A2M8Q010_9CHLR|nr:MAG: hypothetical protein CUN49_01940 [Candidatus Thermofonsia Clade 1 bacterium]PJF43109.1 MAG: hypothetical protein CUN50_01600 [Candidatus Thermofonsia Clade 1 bacterium]RMF51933.1 MAG: hypothetical protein D6749_06370 [Chloroflexota bacterium]